MSSPLPPADAAPSSGAAPGVPCPVCRTTLVPGARECRACGISLVSPAASRLWKVEQEMARLDADRVLLAQEAAGLREALVARAGRRPAAQPAVPAVPAASAALPRYPGFPAAAPVSPAAPAGPMFPSAQEGAPRPRREIGGQQLLLGLGAFLLLSGVSFFLWVVWDLIGVAGQAVVMLLLTAAAAGSAHWATRKHLPAAAETAAVVASGLLALDVTAAHRLGLLGLDLVDPSLYFGVGGALAALVLLGFDRLVPARDGSGQPLRAVRTYRPLSALTASLSTWTLLDLGSAEREVALSALLLLAAAIGTAVTVGFARYDRRGPRVEAVPVSALLAALPALMAAFGHVSLALFAGYGPGEGADRWIAAGLLAVLPTVAAVAAFARRGTGTDLARTLTVVAVLGYALVLGVPLWAADRPVLAVIAALSGLALVALTVLPAFRGTGHWWPGVARTSLSGLGVGLWLLLLLLDAADASSMISLVNGRADATDMAWWMPVIALGGVLVHRVLLAARTSSAWAHTVAGTILLAVVTTALRRADAELWTWIPLALAVASVALAWTFARRDAATPAAPAAPATPVVESLRGAEAVHLVLGGAWTLMAYAGATFLGVGEELLVCLVAALAYAAHAARPGRLDVGYASVALVSVASWVLAADSFTAEVEAWTLVPALGLLAMGLLRHAAGLARSSFGVMGPALLVGLLPSALVALDGSDVLRTLLVTLVALVLLLGGCALRWQTPVVAGALVLIGVGWSQGGELIAWLPGWSLLVGSGALLLVVGVMWERSLELGRRSTGWITSLW